MDRATPPSEDWKRLHEGELRALAAAPGERIASATVGGERVWIKRFDRAGTPLPRRLHALVSPVLYPVHLRSSPALDGAGMAAREVRKGNAFRAAGFPAPEILWQEHSVLVLSDMGSSIKERLAKLGKTDMGAQARLIVACADALGRLHAASLCHGRPHPRDMCLDTDGRIGFFDFEEEPEAAMPLAAAQARDLWLFFQHTALLSPLPHTREDALHAYQAVAPKDVLPQLKPLLRFFRPAALLELGLPKSLVHHDHRRIVVATNFLRTFS